MRNKSPLLFSLIAGCLALPVPVIRAQTTAVSIPEPQSAKRQATKQKMQEYGPYVTVISNPVIADQSDATPKNTGAKVLEEEQNAGSWVAEPVYIEETVPASSPEAAVPEETESPLPEHEHEDFTDYDETDETSALIAKADELQQAAQNAAAAIEANAAALVQQQNQTASLQEQLSSLQEQIDAAQSELDALPVHDILPAQQPAPEAESVSAAPILEEGLAPETQMSDWPEEVETQVSDLPQEAAAQSAAMQPGPGQEPAIDLSVGTDAQEVSVPAPTDTEAAGTQPEDEAAISMENPVSTAAEDGSVTTVQPDAANTQPPASQEQPPQQSALDQEAIPDLQPIEDSENAQWVLLQSRVQDLHTEKAAVQAQLDALPVQTESTPVEIPAFAVADNLHDLKAQLNDLESTLQKLQSNEISGEGADKLLEATTQRIAQVKEQLGKLERVNVYRVYNPNSGEHHYTLDEVERQYLVQAGWKDEGIGWKTPKNQKTVPVYRVYNPNAGDHHYTLDEVERKYLIKEGWKDEGIGWYSDAAFEGLTIYRLYNPNAIAGSHHYTDSKIENDYLANHGWKQEGISWYGIHPYSIVTETNDYGTGTVAYDEQDRKVTGRLVVGGYTYYFQKDSGFRVSGVSKVEDPDNPGQQFTIYALDNGEVQFGWQRFPDGHRYFEKNTGRMVTGFYNTEDGPALFNDIGFAKTGSYEYKGANITTDGRGVMVKSDRPVSALVQWDARWNKTKIGPFNFGGTGCVPTVLSMVINALSGQQVRPDELGARLHEAGFFNTSADIPGTTSGAFAWTAAQYNLQLTSLQSSEMVRNTLAAGGLVSAAMNPGLFCEPGLTHEIFVYGYDNGKVNVFDPYWTEHNGSYNYDVIFAQKSTNRYDTPNGGPLFGWSIKA